MALSSLATAGTGARGAIAGAALGEGAGASVGPVPPGRDGAGADSPFERRGGGGAGGPAERVPAERTGAGGALLRASSGAFEPRDSGGNGGGTERETGRTAGAGFFGEFVSSAMTGINLSRP